MNHFGRRVSLCALLFLLSGCALNSTHDSRSAQGAELTDISPKSVKALTKKGGRLAD